jgi:hypothetical protein
VPLSRWASSRVGALTHSPVASHGPSSVAMLRVTGVPFGVVDLSCAKDTGKRRLFPRRRSHPDAAQTDRRSPQRTRDRGELQRRHRQTAPIPAATDDRRTEALSEFEAESGRARE